MRDSGFAVRSAERREWKRDQLLAAAERLLIDSGVERMRLRDVADAAGVSIGTLQHYFDTRDRLVAELFDWSARRRLDAWVSLEPGDADAWRRIETLLARALGEPLLERSRIWVEFLAMARNDELRAKLAGFYDAWRRPFREAIDDGIASGLFAPALPTDGLVDLLITMVDGAEAAAVLAPPGFSRERTLSTQIAAARSLLGVRLESARAG